MKSLRSLAAFGLAAGAGYCLTRVFERRRSFAGQVVVITGGSRGLGLEMARLWVAEGARVAICARSAEELERAIRELSLTSDQVFGMTCDVTDAAQARTFIEAVFLQWGRIDVLVNNAGIIQVGPMDCMTHADYEQALATHLWGPIFMTEAVLPIMRRQRAGRIVNIASIGGRVSVPHLLPYSASKFALVGWSEGLAAELDQAGITVTTVSPGLMRTGSPRNALFKGRHRQEYAWFSIGTGMPILATHSERAARRIIDGCRRGDAVVAISAVSAIASRVHGLCPGLTVELLKRVNRWLPDSSPQGHRNFKGSQSESAIAPSLLTAANEVAALRNNEL